MTEFVANASTVVKQDTHMEQTVLRRPAATAALAMVVFVALAALVRGLGVGDWERSITRSVFEWPDAFAVVLRPAMELGNRLVAVVVAIVVGWRRGIRAGVTVCAGALAAWVVATVGKGIVGRPRISAVALGAPARDAVHSASFPSSHVAVAVAVAVGVALVGVGRPRWALLPVALLTGVARMWVGVHLPLDLVGGALVGVAGALGAVAVARRV